MKWAGKPKRVKTTFNGRTERGKYIKPFCPEKEERKRNDPNGRGWSPQMNTCGASVGGIRLSGGRVRDGGEDLVAETLRPVHTQHCLVVHRNPPFPGPRLQELNST